MSGDDGQKREDPLKIKDAPTAEGRWLADPFHWTKVGDGYESRNTGRAFVEASDGASDACLYREATVSAKVTPRLTPGKDWETFGVALKHDDANYWALSFVDSPDGRHHLELCEMRGGTWLSQDLDHLPRRDEARPVMDWTANETYEVTLSLDAREVRGVIRDSRGRTVFNRVYAIAGKPGVGAVAPAVLRMGAFQGRVSTLKTALAGPQPISTRPDWPPYTARSNAPQIAGTATGFFHTERIDGRWWVIDPLGRGFVVCGCEHVYYDAARSARSRRSYHKEANDRLFKSKADWEAATLARLGAWGFNLVGGDRNLHHRGLAHTAFLSIGDALCYDETSDEHYILRNEHRPCSAFPNVFHPDFPAWCESVARRKCRPNRDDPWLMGYFLDNEFRWWGHGGSRCEGLFNDAAKLRPDHAAHRALLAHVARETGGGLDALARLSPERQIEVKRGYLKLCAEKYFSITTTAIRRADPNHMILGARFAGPHGADDVVWEEAGKWTDLVTFNCYPWCDLNREAIYEHSGARAPLLTDVIARLAAVAKKPMYITEWSFPALDTGRPCLHGAGQRMPTQVERVKATELCAKTMLASPVLVGYDYFMWADQPAEGISDAFPEDSNYGLMDINAMPHKGITEMFARVQDDAGRLRFAPPPTPRPIPPGVRLTAAEAWRRVARPGDDRGTFTERNGRFTFSNRSGVTLAGRRGSGHCVDSFTVGGVEYGPLTVMICLGGAGGQLRWPRVNETTGVAWDPAEKALSVTARGLVDGQAFGARARFRLAGRRVMMEVAEIANPNAKPLKLRTVYVSALSPFAAESDAARREEPPNRWLTESRTGWRAKDGRQLDVTTRSPTVDGTFRYWVSEEGSVHPDAGFDAPGADADGFRAIAPGETLTLGGTCWAWLEPGRSTVPTGPTASPPPSRQ